MTFRVVVEIEITIRPGARGVLPAMLVDTGAKLSWFPSDAPGSSGIERDNIWRFRQADGTVIAGRRVPDGL